LGGKKGPKARALLIDRKWRLVTEKRDFSELVTNPRELTHATPAIKHNTTSLSRNTLDYRAVRVRGQIQTHIHLLP